MTSSPLLLTVQAAVHLADEERVHPVGESRHLRPVVVPSLGEK
jgi:hypothetical protein